MMIKMRKERAILLDILNSTMRNSLTFYSNDIIINIVNTKRVSAIEEKLLALLLSLSFLLSECFS